MSVGSPSLSRPVAFPLTETIVEELRIDGWPMSHDPWKTWLIKQRDPESTQSCGSAVSISPALSCPFSTQLLIKHFAELG